uniref:NADH-ubiquinone oxidoreductase chain 4 n=1 Tax=Singhiella simplex TaxID=1608328 RepID=A0A7G2CVY9_9HEMI|nr:NADH dehydrogenase subunit 4 [Singhiella simplex]
MMIILTMIVMMIVMSQASTLTKKAALALMTLLINFNAPSLMSNKLGYFMVMDALSFWILQLTMWLMFIIMMMKTNATPSLSIMVFIMTLILLITFTTWNFMMFYITFEASMIVVVVMMVTWGYQPERAEAIMLMVIMTIAVSIPFLTSIMLNAHSISFWLMQTSLSITDYMSFMLVFAMKMPVFFLHSWLPKVHVESPVQSSMLLAGVLLKLGSYGMIRTTTMTFVISKTFASLIISFGVWTSLVLSAVCLVQTDLKTIIAYSSVVHMTMVMVAILMNKSQSVIGSIMVMLGHGMCSSGLFFMANTVYKTSKSRSVIISKGVLKTTPIMIMMWFWLCMGNAPMPPSINIMGEFLTFSTITNWNTLTYMILVPLVILSSMYSIYLFYLMSHGHFTSMTSKINPTTSKANLIVMLHLIPMLAMMMKPQMLMM